MKMLSNADLQYLSRVENELRKAMKQYDFSPMASREKNADLLKVIVTAVEVLKANRRGFRAERIVNQYAEKAGRKSLTL